MKKRKLLVGIVLYLVTCQVSAQWSKELSLSNGMSYLKNVYTTIYEASSFGGAGDQVKLQIYSVPKYSFGVHGKVIYSWLDRVSVYGTIGIRHRGFRCKFHDWRGTSSFNAQYHRYELSSSVGAYVHMFDIGKKKKLFGQQLRDILMSAELSNEFRLYDSINYHGENQDDRFTNKRNIYTPRLAIGIWAKFAASTWGIQFYSDMREFLKEEIDERAASFKLYEWTLSMHKPIRPSGNMKRRKRR